MGGYGSFFVIDLIERRIKAEYPAGAFSQLCLSPDGKSVYISDPGGYLYQLQSSGKVWKYDVQSKTIITLLSSLNWTNKIVVAEDNRTIFISAWVSFILPNGQRASVIKADGISGRIINSYMVPKDTSGFWSNHPRNIRLGRYRNEIVK